MAKFLTEVRGFTPVIDVVVQDIGLVTAAVYGVMWRYCQMEDHVCKAAMETIAAKIGIERRTAMRHVAALVTAGYVVDTTPDAKNAPHVYRDAGRVRIAGLLGVTESDTEVSLSDTPVSLSATPGCHSKRHKDSSLRKKAREKKEEAAAAASVTCSLHDKSMLLRSRSGDTWYSHRLPDGSWCKGTLGDQPTARIDPRRYIKGRFADLIQS